MKWKKDHKLPNTKSKLPDQLPASIDIIRFFITSSYYKTEQQEIISTFIKEESFSGESSN